MSKIYAIIIVGLLLFSGFVVFEYRALNSSYDSLQKSGNNLNGSYDELDGERTQAAWFIRTAPS